MSSKSLLLLLSTGLLVLCLSGRDRKAAFYPKKPKEKVSRTSGLAKAMVLGNKSGVKKKDLNVLRSFGVMHILTPSGLHLSSFLAVFKLFPRFRLAIAGLMLCGSFFVPGFLSLQRMLIFCLVSKAFKDVKVSFILTMLIALICGNVEKSPLSFCFSLVFWGCILFHRGSKKKLVIHLFLLQSLIALFFRQEMNLLGVVVNPLLTGMFTLIFPVLLLTYPLPGAESYLLKPFVWLIDFFALANFLNFQPLISVGFGCLLIYPKKRLAIIACLLFSQVAGAPDISKRKYQRTASPIPSRHELLKAGVRHADFIDRKCRYDYKGWIKCKKKPSAMGGPSI